ncbi:MAG: DUF2085 domain-containing protein [Balneolaceae bacterium]
MWAIQAHNKSLYAGIFAAAVFLMFTALGPGIFGSQTMAYNSWQYQIFNTLCHQDPLRSYSISGMQMAVCSRCLGIYGAFLVGWMSMPLYALIKSIPQNVEKNWLIAAILLNLVDVLTNFFGIWTNTLISRILLGGFMGLPMALILANEFFTYNKSE